MSEDEEDGRVLLMWPLFSPGGLRVRKAQPVTGMMLTDVFWNEMQSLLSSPVCY